MTHVRTAFFSHALFVCLVSSIGAVSTTRAQSDDFLSPLITAQSINERMLEVSAQINADYAGKEIALVMVMKGSICVAADLMRQITVPCTLDFMQASSYGMNGTVAGSLTVTGLDKIDFTRKHVLLVDDIFDTGKTLCTLKKLIEDKNPASIKTLVLLSKKIDRSMTYTPDYVLFEVDNLFVVGYGLDYKNHFRGLPGIYVLKQIPAWLR